MVLFYALFLFFIFKSCILDFIIGFFFIFSEFYKILKNYKNVGVSMKTGEKYGHGSVLDRVPDKDPD